MKTWPGCRRCFMSTLTCWAGIRFRCRTLWQRASCDHYATRFYVPLHLKPEDQATSEIYNVYQANNGAAAQLLIDRDAQVNWF